MLKLAKEKGEVRVVNEETSCFTYTVDLAKAVKSLIEGSHPYGVYHLTNGGVVSWYDGAKALFKLAGLEVKTIPIGSAELPRPAKRPKYSALINTKLPPLRPYEEALKEYLEFIK
jgi:dTDP-4-dehydrorhamnose reductase